MGLEPNERNHKLAGKLSKIKDLLSLFETKISSASAEYVSSFDCVPACNLERYAIQSSMIKSFRHKGLQLFFETDSKRGIQAHHASRLRRQLMRLDIATKFEDVNVPGWRLHALTGDLAGNYSITVSGNWRITFAFEGRDVVLVDYQDYH